MISIHMTEEQVQNLLIFLTRASLTGKEVPAFNDIVAALQNATSEQNISE